MSRLGVVALGDSITNGEGTMVLGVPARSWAQWLAQALDLPFTNYARDGAFAPDVLAGQVPRLRADYDVACLYAGANDVRSIDWDAGVFEEAYAGVLATLGDHAARTVTLTIPLDLGRPRAGAKVGEANAIIARLSAGASAACGDLTGLRGWRSVMPDAVHATALGQLEMADAAARALAAAGAGAAVLPSALADVDRSRAGAARYALTYAEWLARDAWRRARER